MTDDKQTRERAIAIAVEAAEADTIQSYTSERPFVPHVWVVSAITKALTERQRTPVQLGERISEIIAEVVNVAIERRDRERAYGVRLDNLGADLTKAEGTIKNMRGTVEGMGMTLAEQNQRAIALHARVDALERGRTGAGWIGDMGHAMQRHGDVVGITRDPTTAALENVRAELDIARRKYDEVKRDRDHLHARGAEVAAELIDARNEAARRKDDHNRTMRKLGEATGLLEQCARAAGMEELGSRAENAAYLRKRIADLDDSLKLYRDGKIVSEAGDRPYRELHDGIRHVLGKVGDAPVTTNGIMTAVAAIIAQRDEARRGYKCAVDERDALEKQRDEAVRQRDQYGERNKAHSTTTAEQARTIADLREALGMATADRDRFNAGMSDANSRLAEVQAKAASRMRVISDQAEQITELREQLRVADGDRIPLRMDLDAERDAHKQTREKCGRMQPLVVSAQVAANAWQHELDANLRGLSGPMHKALCDLGDAAGVYETACAQAADAETDGESDPGSAAE